MIHLNRKFHLIGLLVLIFLVPDSCKPVNTIKLADNSAFPATKELYRKIKKATGVGVLIGHQDDTPYGVGWKYEEGKTTSDIEMVCGDYPALYGWEIGGIENDNSSNLDTVYFNLMRKLIAEAHKRGGIQTISWHANNPITGENAWSEKETVKYIFSDEKNKAVFVTWLNKVSEFLKSLKDEEGNVIPVIFRPWHEWNGSWFWWGTPHSGNEEFIELWRLTVETLRDKNNVHNVLYAFSPGSFETIDEFMKKYPGNDYVDIIGFDTYMYEDDIEAYRKIMSKDLQLISEIAKTENKLYAVTETGYEGIPSDNWYSEVVYPLLKDSGASWVLFWRNATTKHHYAPYPGHRSAEDFKRFYNFPETLFERDFSKLFH